MSPKRLEDMYDAVIVGAGAAGLSAALGLLRSPEITELKEQYLPATRFYKSWPRRLHDFPDHQSVHKSYTSDPNYRNTDHSH